MEYKSYQHIERWGTDETEGIEKGKCFVFPKIDGTNATVYLGDDGTVKAGSRKRELTLDHDNAGFYAAITQDQRIASYLKEFPNHRLYGEWLVPHTVRTYTDEAWRKFYIFDVVVDDKTDGTSRYLPYEFYKPFLEKHGLDYIPLLGTVADGKYEDFVKFLDQNHYLIKDGMGTGEGIVIKNYEFRNKYGRLQFAKIVADEFKQKKHTPKAQRPDNDTAIEPEIARLFITEPFVRKEYSKLAQDGWNSKMIPRFLNTVYHEFITEEMWGILKKYKHPVIDFKTLYKCSVDRIKEVMPELF